MRIAFRIFFALILIGCQAEPALELTASPATLSVETPLPIASPTLSPPSTAVLPAAVSPAELKRRAAPICENAFSALVETGPLIPPFAVMKNQTYAESPAWEVSRQLPHLGSLSAAEVETLFCISETRTQAGTYTDGSPAYQLFWDVRIVSWPGGRIIGKQSFTGSPPAETEGEAPYAAFAEWVFNQVEHPTFLYSEHAVTALAISPHNDLAAFGTAVEHQIVDRDFQAQVYLFDPADVQTQLGTSAYQDVLEGHQGMVTSLAFSPDGNVLVSSGYDSFVKFWDVETGRLLGQLGSMQDTPHSLVFSPDGRRLAVATNRQILFIDAASMQVEQSIAEASGNDLMFSPDGTRLYARASGSIRIIDPETGRVTLTFPHPSTLVPTITFDEAGNVDRMTFETPETVDGFALSSDGSRIYTYTIDRAAKTGLGEENVRLAAWDATSGKYLSEIKFLADSESFTGMDLVKTIDISPDGAWLASGYGDTLWLWDTATWQVIKELRGHIDPIEDILFTPDGTKLLSTAGDGTIRVWPVQE